MNDVKPDPSFFSEWRDEISSEACTKLDCGDPAGSVLAYLREMSEQAERTQGIERDKAFYALVEQTLNKRQDVIDVCFARLGITEAVASIVDRNAH